MYNNAIGYEIERCNKGAWDPKTIATYIEFWFKLKQIQNV